ncbi:MAG TPA: hypothetical protein VMN76_03205 [Acidobacteriota bacterium]|nr:hypothetical protein [Acidobacteriota bacterium]
MNENEIERSVNARKSAVNNFRMRSLVSNDEGDVPNQAGASAETERRRVTGVLRGFGGWGRSFGF